MYSGEKDKAEKVFYAAMNVIKEKTNENPFDVFSKAIENVSPEIEVRSRRVGGATYQVPVEVRQERKVSLAIRWIVINSRERKEKGYVEKLSAELIEAFKNTGNAVKKKIETHKMAEANRAFAHLKW
jgi:small subunit ribosomal protein S7